MKNEEKCPCCSGKSYGERGVFLSNSHTKKLIEANKRYEIQFELWLQNETLDTKNIDINLGSDVWAATNYKNEKGNGICFSS